MDEADAYFTITGPATGQLREKASKFLAFAWPVETEAEIKNLLTALRKEHPAANHYCYAWRLGADKKLFRANDDGEPSNSAGKPIFSVIQGKELSNVLIVVVRYFGGTLLGVNGLINAYRDAAVEAINNGVIEQRFVMLDYRVAFEMNDMNPVMRILKECNAKVLTNSYEEKNVITFRVRKKEQGRLEERLREVYAAELREL